MGLKGHATIELTNVETGEKEIHEDDNLVTNGLQALLDPAGIFQKNGLRGMYHSSSDGYKPILRATGGLLLFDEVLSEDPNLLYSPPGVGLTGCGSGIAYTGKNTCAGSYNLEESGAIENGYKHVWDFGTSQANGKIACASLTTQAGGKASTGSYPFDSSYVYDESTEVLFGNEYYSEDKSLFVIPKPDDYRGGFSTSYPEGYTVLYLDGTKNRILLANTDAWAYNCPRNDVFTSSIFYKKGIDIKVIRAGLTNVSIFDNLGGTNFDCLDVIDEVHVDMPNGLAELITSDMLDTTKNRYFSLFRSVDDNYMYFIIRLPDTSTTSTYEYIKPDDKIYVWKINVDTFESTYHVVTNTTGEKLFMAQTAEPIYTTRIDMIAFDDYIVCVGYTSKKIYLINLNDSTDISVLKWPTGDEATGVRNDSYGLGLSFHKNGKLYFIANRDANFFYVIDPVLKQIAYINVKGNIILDGNHVPYFGLFHIKGTNWIAGVACYRAGSYNYRPRIIVNYIDPAILITINNLASPVIKTSSQTMKVTYTLTKSIE